ncbi:hypothetical protein GCM10009001_26450 [Virgibacillus siamensis]|uniref:Helix-turn-helix domain-containing protein n=1 Tax=Virgibacillus siamensis TaxID=480071 RepID=A0ABN1GB86_9BACI
MATTMDNEQKTLWNTVKLLSQLQDKEKAETLLKTTIEKSLRLMNVYTPVVSQLRFSVPVESYLDEMKQIDAQIREKIEISQSEQIFEELLDYIEMISKMTEKPQETNRKMLASILAEKTQRPTYVGKILHSPMNKTVATNTQKESNHPYYTTREAAHKLGLSDQTIRRMCENERFQGAYRSEGGHWRIPEENFITSKKQDKRIDEFFEQIDMRNEEAGDVDEFNL